MPRDWKTYNESLVRRGEILLDLDFINNWDKELEEMNKGKEGKPYQYPNSFISLLAIIHAYLLPYRQLEGFIKALSNYTNIKVPDYTSIAWRVNRLDIKIDNNINTNEPIIIVVDSSGIKVANRGEWINKKWKIRRGFIKMHIAVDVKSKKIVALEITKEDVHDNKKFKDLIDKIDAKIDKVIADGAYDSNDNFNYLIDKGIEPIIKVRSNSIIKGNSIRDMYVLDQLSDYTRWKYKHDYGKRWIAESVFSSLKRMFGEYIKAVKWDNIVKELMIKASAYNLFISMSNGYG